MLDDEQLFTNLDHLKLNDYERFLAIGEMGKQIQALAKEEDVGGLEALCDKHRLTEASHGPTHEPGSGMAQPSSGYGLNTR